MSYKTHLYNYSVCQAMLKHFIYKTLIYLILLNLLNLTCFCKTSLTLTQVFYRREEQNQTLNASPITQQLVEAV